MTSQYPLEVLLWPAMELYTATVCFTAVALCIVAPWTFALTPLLDIMAALDFAWPGIVRLKQAGVVLRYRQNIRRLPKHMMTSAEMPVSNEHLFTGRGLPWTQEYTQRLADTYLPQFASYAEPSSLYERARRLKKQLELALFPLKLATGITTWDVAQNLARPLLPVGSLPQLHGTEPREQDVGLQLSECVGHTLVLGTMRVGKTRLAELFVTQNIRHTHCRNRCRRTKMGRRTQTVHHDHRRRRVEEQPGYEVVIVFNPKGDADLFEHMYVECECAGRLDEFYVFHLDHPDLSARYNAVGRFGRISRVATRVVGQLSGEGNSAAFREFARWFVSIIARALYVLGIHPDYQQILRHVMSTDALFVEYVQKCINEYDPRVWDTIIHIEGKLNDKNAPFNMKRQPFHVMAVYQHLTQKRITDPIMEGLKSTVRYDKTYFDKIVTSLLPLLEKLATGRISELLSLGYADLNDPRPIFGWTQVIRKRVVVYVGLDTPSDTGVAAAVGNSMFSDLVSVAGYIYKRGIDDGLPGSPAGGKVHIDLYTDKFSELIGDEFIPMVNKAGSVGVQMMAHAQTISGIEARIGPRTGAGQVVSNFNDLFMLRVHEVATAELSADQFPKVQTYISTPASGTNGTVSNKKTAFTSNSHDQVQVTSVPMLESTHIVGLPRGQAFALFEGGNLWKIRMLLPVVDPGEATPKSLQEPVADMRKDQAANNERREVSGCSALQDGLPQDLAGDFRHLGAGEDTT